MELSTLKKIVKEKGGSKIYVKKLAANDNSKNQVYLGGSFDVLNMFPFSDVSYFTSGSWKRERFKAKINFHWIDETGKTHCTPDSQLILYPKYPEVRFSGFLKGCKESPSELMTSRQPDRLLFMAVVNLGEILGYVTESDSALAKEFNALTNLSEKSVFYEIPIDASIDTRLSLLTELDRINKLGWIKSKRLNSKGDEYPCNSSNCGGYTLEAELGITPNGYSEPDYLGWEIKQFSVKDFKKLQSSIITLMTPEPTGGFYTRYGVKEFVYKYGYDDKHGKADRMNFGGTHKVGIKHESTNLTLKLIGFDVDSGKIRNTDGRIALLDECKNETASWSFTSMLKHWNRKHHQACYIPSILTTTPNRQYTYGKEILICENTNFLLFLNAMAAGDLFYDPGIKVEKISTAKPKAKRRSQFRIKSDKLSGLYDNFEITGISSALAEYKK